MNRTRIERESRDITRMTMKMNIKERFDVSSVLMTEGILIFYSGKASSDLKVQSLRVERRRKKRLREKLG